MHSLHRPYERIITVQPAELPPVCNVPSVELLQTVKEFSLEELKMETMKRPAATQSQKLMIFVLTMALYGMATLFTELIPSFQVGVAEFSVE